MTLTLELPILSVNRCIEPQTVGKSLSAIQKTRATQDARIFVGRYGLLGDRQVNRKHHGGRRKGVYFMFERGVDSYADRLGVAPGKELRHGVLLGENFTLGGDFGDWDICEGDELICDDVRIRLTTPRQPCATLQALHRHRGVNMSKLMIVEGYDCGFYGQVETPGWIDTRGAFTLRRYDPTGRTMRGVFNTKIRQNNNLPKD